MGPIDNLLHESYFQPDARLVKALAGKLTVLEIDLLRIWLNEERLHAAYSEWAKHRDRIQAEQKTPGGWS